MIARLRAWLYWDSFPEAVKKLPVPGEGDPRDGANFLGLVTETLETLARAEEQLRHRRLGEGGAAAERELLNLMKALLPSLDSLDRMIDFLGQSVSKDPELANWLTSLHAFRTKYLRTLEQAGLTPVNSVGSKVDLDMHEVVQTVTRPGIAPDTVVGETQKAYLFKGKPLRDAKVIVAH